MKAQGSVQRARYTEPYARGDTQRKCPVCNGPVDRIHRRLIDRFMCLFRPAYRYRCRSKGWGCDWEGNLY